jgi:hypothetical protein
MILRFLLDILIVYCIGSYIACGYALWFHRKELSSNQSATASDKAIGMTIFFVFAPFMMAEIFVKRLLNSER